MHLKAPHFQLWEHGCDPRRPANEERCKRRLELVGVAIQHEALQDFSVRLNVRKDGLCPLTLGDDAYDQPVECGQEQRDAGH